MDAIGANAMTGVSDNLAAVLEQKYAAEGLCPHQDRADAPLADAVALLDAARR